MHSLRERRPALSPILNLCIFGLARRFALDGDGPRSLRAAVGASVVLLLWACGHLLSGVAPSKRH